MIAHPSSDRYSYHSYHGHRYYWNTEFADSLMALGQGRFGAGGAGYGGGGGRGFNAQQKASVR